MAPENDFIAIEAMVKVRFTTEPHGDAGSETALEYAQGYLDEVFNSEFMDVYIDEFEIVGACELEQG